MIAVDLMPFFDQRRRVLKQSCAMTPCQNQILVSKRLARQGLFQKLDDPVRYEKRFVR